MTLLVALSLLACRVPECTDNTGCPATEACVRGRCKQVDCLSSKTCDIGQYCSEDTWSCVDGCQYDSDCLEVDRCDPLTKTCVPRSCQDTATDCPAGERCDQSSGQCYEDPAPHCAPCTSTQQCGNLGQCFGFTSHSGYCLLYCNPEDAQACPAGYSCSLVSDGNYYCVGFCPLM